MMEALLLVNKTKKKQRSLYTYLCIYFGGRPIVQVVQDFTAWHVSVVFLQMDKKTNVIQEVVVSG